MATKEHLVETISQIRKEKRKFFRMANLIWQLKEVAPEEWLVLLSKIGLGNRMSRYYATIHETVRSSYTDMESFEYLGVAKMAVMCTAGVFGVSPEKNDYWAAVAEKHSLAHLSNLIHEKTLRSSRTVALSDEEAKLFTKAMVKAGMTYRGKTRIGQAEALVKVCTMFLQQG